MKQSQLVIKAHDKNITAVELSQHGQLALVNLDVLRELINIHTFKMSLRDLKDQAINRIDKCQDAEEYENILAHELAMLQLHINLRAYDNTRLEEKRKKEEEDARSNTMDLQ